MSLFGLKCALNNPNCSKTPKIYNKTAFQKIRETNFIAFKNLAAATHFPPPLNLLNYSPQHRLRGLKFGMKQPFKCLQKFIFAIFLYLEWLPLC